MSRRTIGNIVTGIIMVTAFTLTNVSTVVAFSSESRIDIVESSVESIPAPCTDEEYKILLEENEKLKKENEKLKAQIYDLQNVEEDETELPAMEVEEAPVKKTTEEFLNAIQESYNARQVVSNKYSVSETNMMSENEIAVYYTECAEAERSFYNEYKNTIYDDLNIQYLCNQYIKGLSMQYEAANKYAVNKDYNSFITVYILTSEIFIPQTVIP